MNTFHQMGAWFLQPDSQGLLPIGSLKTALSEIVETVFGKDVKYKFLEDTFPYTDPSLQIEVFIPSNTEGEEGRWIEIMGGGMPKKSALKKLGLEGYNGWAFGFGLERLAIISMQLPDIRLLWSEDERVKKQLKLGNVYPFNFLAILSTQLVKLVNKFFRLFTKLGDQRLFLFLTKNFKEVLSI